MTHRSLFRTGVLGAGVAAVCCATPLVPFVLGGIGLSAWISRADQVVIPLGVAFAALAWWARHRAATPRCSAVSDATSSHQGEHR